MLQVPDTFNTIKASIPRRRKALARKVQRTKFNLKRAGQITNFAVRHPFVTREVIKRAYPTAYGVTAGAANIGGTILLSKAMGAAFGALSGTAATTPTIDLSTIPKWRRATIMSKMTPVANTGMYALKNRKGRVIAFITGNLQR